MKRRRLPPSPRLKRQYNLCHRLRLQGVQVDTVGNAIAIAGSEQYEALPALARKYIQALTQEYRFVVQTYIPVESGRAVEQGTPAAAIKFSRKRPP